MECYTRLVEKVRELGYAVYLTENDGRDSFLEEVAQRCDVGIVPVWTPILMCGAVLAGAKLFISGTIPSRDFGLPRRYTVCVFRGGGTQDVESAKGLGI